MIPLLWWIPVLVIAFGFIRWMANDQIIHRITSYVRTTYPFYGWEAYGHLIRQNVKPIRKYVDWWPVIVYFWALALVGSVVMAITMTTGWPWSSATSDLRLRSIRTSTASVLDDGTMFVAWKGSLVDERNQDAGQERGQCFAEGDDGTECLVELSTEGVKLVFSGKEKLDGFGELALLMSTGTHEEGSLRWTPSGDGGDKEYVLTLR